MNVKNPNIYPVILAGGNGTRLWPLSRELSPKQLLEIGDNKSLIKMSVERCSLFTDNVPTIVTNKKQGQSIKTDLGDTRAEFVLEPEAKNTAPAIALVAAHIYHINPKAIVTILPSDHFLDEKALAVCVKTAAAFAHSEDKVVLIGIKPTRPETGYGYIEYNKKSRKDGDIFEVISFKEKPDHALAEKYLKSGSYLWSAGMFVASVETLKKEIKANMPELACLFEVELTDSNVEKIYNSAKSTPIDYGLIEKIKNLSVVKADMDWNDLGNWGAIHDISKKDKQGNYYKGKHIGLDNEETLVYSNTDRLIATIGLRNLVIVDTEDATLVCDKDNSQEIKQIVEKIKSNDKDKLIRHKTTKTPWGKYTILDEGEGFKVKFLHLLPGAKISLQTHQHRTEHWVIVDGKAKVTIGENEKKLGPNESIFIPTDTLHRLENISDAPLIVVEVATGPYIEEDDIKRFEDIYKRV